MPVLGHANWNLYRRALEPDSALRADYRPREKNYRPAADFSSVLFPTRR